MNIKAEIKIIGNRAYISGLYPIDVVREATSYDIEGAQFTSLYRRKIWDGKEHLFKKKDSSFPSGLVNLVKVALKEEDPEAVVTIEDCREISPPIIGNSGFTLSGLEFGKGKYNYQLEAVRAFIDKKRGILKLATGAGKTACAAAIIKHLAIPTIFLVNSVDLVYQTREVFSKVLQVPLEDIGLIGDSKFTIGNWITVAGVAGIASKLGSAEVIAMLNKWQLVIADEVHHASSKEFFTVLEAIPAYWRCALSGTPLYRGDNSNIKIIAQTGDIVYEIRNKDLIDLGVAVQPHIEIIKITSPKIPAKTVWATVNKLGIVENEELNQKVVDKAIEFVNQGLKTVILVEQIVHGQALESKLGVVGAQFIQGSDSTEVRQKALQDLANGKLDCIIGTSLMDEGIDCKPIGAIIFASAGKSKIKTLQRLGRGLRLFPGKDKLVVVDFANYCHKFLTKHSLERLHQYQAEECFVISYTE